MPPTTPGRHHVIAIAGDSTENALFYVRELSGNFFEFATPSPGFTVDEDLGGLGSRPTLPPWLGGVRDEIEAQLPDFEPPRTAPTDD